MQLRLAGRSLHNLRRRGSVRRILLQRVHCTGKGCEPFHTIVALGTVAFEQMCCCASTLSDAADSTCGILPDMLLGVVQRDGCPKIINLGSARTDLFYERKRCCRAAACLQRLVSFTQPHALHKARWLLTAALKQLLQCLPNNAWSGRKNLLVVMVFNTQVCCGNSQIKMLCRYGLNKR